MSWTEDIITDDSTFKSVNFYRWFGKYHMDISTTYRLADTWERMSKFKKACPKFLTTCTLCTVAVANTLHLKESRMLFGCCSTELQAKMVNISPSDLRSKMSSLVKLAWVHVQQTCVFAFITRGWAVSGHSLFVQKNNRMCWVFELVCCRRENVLHMNKPGCFQISV